jgi:hypothetical protein
VAIASHMRTRVEDVEVVACLGQFMRDHCAGKTGSDNSDFFHVFPFSMIAQFVSPSVSTGWALCFDA